MEITSETIVARIAAEAPATIRVFQRHQIDFCCGGPTPLGQACAQKGLDLNRLVAELDQASRAGAADARNWQDAPLSELLIHLQSRHHEQLYEELPRLARMMTTVLARHGHRLPGTLPLLADVFERLQEGLLRHIGREDAVLFPAILALEEGSSQPANIHLSIAALEQEHALAGEALDLLRSLTEGYQPPEDACPTFRGLYFGMAELEKDTRVHVHLENHILFPRVLALLPAP